MIKLGLVGYPLSHSYSPVLHKAALHSYRLEGEFELYPVEPGDTNGLSDLTVRLKAGEINGLNVTIPHKQAIIQFVDRMTLTAKTIGAVNTLYFHADELIGDNTDAPGFMADIRKAFKGEFSGKRAIVLGSGGAARAVTYALLNAGWQVTLAVRQADVEQAQSLISSFHQIIGSKGLRIVLLEAGDLGAIKSGVQLIVNATPVGMWPDIINSPWPDTLPFPEGAAVYDLVYNPRETALLKSARRSGLRAATGLGMLVEQARLSFQKWTGCLVEREVMLSAVED